MKNSRWPEKADFPLARPGWKCISMVAGISLLLFLFGWTVAGWCFLPIPLFVIWFFRDPERKIPGEPDCLVSPADGRVILVEKPGQNPYLEGQQIKVSIFMNVFNVHVNRVPFTGVVEKVIYVPGKFLNASLDKASEFNERNALIIRTSAGIRYAVVQIAGLIARRIVSDVKEGDALTRGKRYGMICFGSRLDLYLPENTEVTVSPGDRVMAGTSVVGYIK